MARMQGCWRDSVRPGELMERNKHTELDRGMETAELEEGCRAQQATQGAEWNQACRRPDSQSGPAPFTYFFLKQFLCGACYYLLTSCVTFSPEESVEFGVVVPDLHNVCAGSGGIGAMQFHVALLPHLFALDCRGGVWKACASGQYTYARKPENYRIKNVFKIWMWELLTSGFSRVQKITR